MTLSMLHQDNHVNSKSLAISLIILKEPHAKSMAKRKAGNRKVEQQNKIYYLIIKVMKLH
jgi:hypothetical protein